MAGASREGRMPTGRKTLVARDGSGMRVGADPAIVSNPLVLEFHAYWLARRSGRRFPSRKDIEPTESPDLRSGRVVLDVHGEPVHFKNQLLGDDVRTHL